MPLPARVRVDGQFRACGHTRLGDVQVCVPNRPSAHSSEQVHAGAVSRWRARFGDVLNLQGSGHPLTLEGPEQNRSTQEETSARMSTTSCVAVARSRPGGTKR